MAGSVDAADLKSHLAVSIPADFFRRNDFPQADPNLQGCSECLLSLRGGVCLAEASAAQQLREPCQQIQAQEHSRELDRR